MEDFWRPVIDESKTHLFLSPFFMNIQGLKVQSNVKLWNNLDICFVEIRRKEEKCSRKVAKTTKVAMS